MRTRTVASLREAADRVLQTADLEEVYLVRSVFDSSELDAKPPFSASTTLQVKGSHVPGRIDVRARYQTVATVGDDEPDVVWSAEVECVAVFSVPEDLPIHSDDDVEAFAIVMGGPTLHPYAREYTQSLTAKSAYPAFTLGLLVPVLAFPDDHELELTDREEPDETAV